MPKVELDMEQNDLNDVVQAIYRRWAEEFDALQSAKKATCDGCCPASEWPQTKARMIANNQASFDKWDRIFKQVKHIAKFDI